MAKQFSYALTIKKTRGKPCVKDYELYLDYLEKKGLECYNVNYELTRGLHCHLAIKSTTELAPKDSLFYREKYGWNILAVPIFFAKGWKRYSEKDKKKENVDPYALEKELMSGLYPEVELPPASPEVSEEEMMEDLYAEDPRVKSPQFDYLEQIADEMSHAHLQFPNFDIRKFVKKII